MGNEGSSLPPGADRSCPEPAPGSPVGKDQAARLERLTRLYACLSQVNQAIVWTPERKALLDKICEVMVSHGKFSLAWVGWNDPIDHEVAILSQFGDENGYLEGLRVRSDDTPLGRGGTGTAIRTGRSMVINDFLSSLESSPWHEKATRAGLAASAAIPIRTGGAVVGALMVYAREKDFFGIEELGLLEEAAGDLTFALDHLELDARNRESEATLKLNEELFSKIFKACPDAISIASMDDGTYVEVNQVFLDLMGLRREQVLGRTATDLDVWVDSGDRQHFVNQLARNGSLRHFETRFRMASGAIRDFEVSSEVIQFQGRPHSFNFMRDITERKLKAQALWESEAEFRLLFDKAPMGMAIVDSESGRFLAVNPRMGEILDCPPAELVTRSFQEFTHPDHLESDWKSVRDLAQGLAPEVRKEKRYISRSGRVVWARLTMVLMPGMPRRQLSLVEDISEAHVAQDSLKATLERLQKIADRVPGMVYQYRLRPDGTAHLPYASEAIRDIYRISPEAVRETAAALNGVHHPEDHAAIMASILASAETLTPWKQEYRVKFEDGTVRHLYGDALPEREPDGSTLWTGFITDITERKHLEAQFQQAQKMESLGSLAGGVAHDMNNVLAAILGLASAQQMRHEPGSTTYQAFEIIRSAATRGGSMVKNLLNFARQSPGEEGDVNLNEVLLGVMIGLVAQLIFTAVTFGGTVIGYQMGFAAANIFDPQTTQQLSLMSQFINILALLAFLSFDIHHFFFKIIVESYILLPPGFLDFSQGAVQQLMQLGGNMFVLGVKFSAPILALLLIANLVLGILARVFPQLNVFMLSFPINIGISFLVIGLTLNTMLFVLRREFDTMGENILNLFQLLK